MHIRVNRLMYHDQMNALIIILEMTYNNVYSLLNELHIKAPSLG